jgi:predicted ABC-type ATPase
MSDERLSVIVLAGPNGAGKSTTAPLLLKGTLGVMEFVNADTIAQGLSAFEPDRTAMAAGRIMLGRLDDLARQRVSFAFESTLASRSFAPWITDLTREDYLFHLLFLWLPSPDMAVARVAERVRMGGHQVDEETIRRRYNRGLRNFFELYRPMAVTWRMYDNASTGKPRLVAGGKQGTTARILDQETWGRISRSYADGT